MRPSLLAAAAVLALAAPTLARADETFDRDLAKLMDRYTDDAPADRLGACVALCEKQVAAHADDRNAQLQLARFQLAKGDTEAAAKAAEKVASAPGLTADEKLTARALTFFAVYTGANATLEKTKPEDREKVIGELKARVQELDKQVMEAAGGSKEKAGEVIQVEQGFQATAKSLEKLGKAPLAIDKKDIAGKEIKLDDYKGKVLLIDFWATWCGPCVGELPNVLKVYEECHAKGFEILGISLDQDRAKLDAFLADKKLPWRQYFDGKGWKNEVSSAWGINSIPATYLIDHTGKLRYVGVRGEALGAAVKELLERAAKK
jgi:peroxiredoxin